MKRYIVLLVYLALAAFSAGAELQTWTLADGSTFDAEFVGIFLPDAAFKNADGKVWKIPLDQFTEESLLDLELASPPELSIDFINNRETKNFPSGIRPVTQRPPEVRSQYGIRIKQTSSGVYNHELHCEWFIIGRERFGDKYILLDRQTASFFIPKDKSKTFEHHSERVVVLQNFLVGDDVRGQTYFGHLVIVKDERGEIIAVKSSRDWLYENIENLRERYVNNFMDETCARVFPTRPKVWAPQ